MYIIAIGWLYVILMMAITAKSFTAGLFTFVVYGLAPVALLLWLMGAPIRKKRRAAREALGDAPDQPVDAGHGADAKRDQ
jgi:hypothetical protein